MIYSAILDNYSIIADYSEEQGDFQITLVKLLKANKQPIEFYVIPYSNYEIFFLHYENYTFCCIAMENLDNEKILLFLQILREKFISLCTSEKENLMLKATILIREIMIYYIDHLKNDKFEKIESQLESIKKEKLQIIEKAQEKDHLLDLIMPKSENLKRTSLEMKYNIKKRLETVKKTSLKFYIIGFMVIVFLFMCFYFNFSNSFKN